MSTNFYHRYNACAHCGRYDERHIGKWTSLQGYRRPDWLDEDDLFDEVTTWAQWKADLLHDGEIWDEYGRRWDVREFIKLMEDTEPEYRRRQYDWCVAHPLGYGLDDDHWLDPDGFSFTSRDFT